MNRTRDETQPQAAQFQAWLSGREAEALLGRGELTGLVRQLAAWPTISPEQERLVVSLLASVVHLRRAEIELRARSRVLEMVASGAALDRVLEALTRLAEEVIPQMRCSVLLLDRAQGRLHHGAAPSLPEAYVRAIDGVEIGPGRGSCGTAAHSGERVIVNDVLEHAYWAEYRDIAQQAGFRACWSEPVLSSDRQVLGTFAMYYDEPRCPQEDEIRFIQTTAHLAGIAIERCQQETEIQAHREHLEELVRERTAELRALSSELFLAEERERRRLAQDLHDGLSQWLCLARMKLATWKRRNEREDPLLKEVDEALETAGRAASSLTYQLSPPTLYEFGLRSSFERMLEDLQKGYDLSVNLQCEGEDLALEEQESVIMFRAARELLINVAKHAGTQEADLRLTWRDAELEMTVEDQGLGFDTTAQRRRGFGLFGIRERLEHAGGRMTIVSQPGAGTCVHLTLPLVRPD